MKKYIPLIVAVFSVVAANAQEAFMRKDLLVSAGVGLINYRGRSYDGSEKAGKTVPIFASAEFGVNKFLSIGIFAGYRSMEFRYMDSTVTEKTGSEVFKCRFISSGLKGTVHLTQWLEKVTGNDLISEDLDLYSSVLVGYEYNFLQRAEGFNVKAASKPVAGLVVGGRYYFNYRFAIFAEVGVGVYGIINSGITARF